MNVDEMIEALRDFLDDRAGEGTDPVDELKAVIDAAAKIGLTMDYEIDENHRKFFIAVRRRVARANHPEWT